MESGKITLDDFALYVLVCSVIACCSGSVRTHYRYFRAGLRTILALSKRQTYPLVLSPFREAALQR
jgi:hypothetical protein